MPWPADSIAPAVERPMPGNAINASSVARQFGLVFVDDSSGGRVQIAPARVVAETGPQVQHVVELRARQRADVGEARDEPLEVRNHGRDLRLLQHHFGDPHAIGRARMLPRQVFASVNVEPREYLVGEPGHRSG